MGIILDLLLCVIELSPEEVVVYQLTDGFDRGARPTQLPAERRAVSTISMIGHAFPVGTW